MNRRSFIGFAGLALSSIFSSGCKSSLFNLNSVYDPETVSSVGDIVLVTVDTTITTKPANGTVYRVVGCTLDLNGFTLDGLVSSGIHCKCAAFLRFGGKIKNGKIKNYVNNVTIEHGLHHGFLDALNNVTKAQARIIGDQYRTTVQNREHDGSEIINIDFVDTVKIGVYVTAFSIDYKIKDCTFTNTGHMCIYCDHGSAWGLIEGNHFTRCGYNHSRGKEAIALDGCLNIEVIGNTFNGKCDLGFINIYTNWGESNPLTGMEVTREISRHHFIYKNVFNNNKKGVDVGSRHYKRFAGKTAKDYAENIAARSNTFNNVTNEIIDRVNGIVVL